MTDYNFVVSEGTLASSPLMTGQVNVIDDTVGETAPTTLTVSAGQPTPLTGVQIIDDGLNGETFTTVVTANSGAIYASNSPLGGQMIFGAHSVSISGTLAQVNSALATLVYSNNDPGSDSITVATSDMVDQSSASKSIAINVQLIGGTITLALNNFGLAEGWSSQNVYERTLADVNGDGLPDLVGFGGQGVYVALNEGDGVFGAPTLAINNFGTAEGWSSQDDYPRILADVNGDGKADIVGFGAAGVYVALGQADGTFGAPTLALDNFGTLEGWSSQSVYERTLADVNGDGLPDLVGFGGQGVYVALNEGDGVFGAPKLAINNFGTDEGWSSQDQYPRFLADVNHDGKADIVGFGAAGVYVALGQADGTFGAPTLALMSFGTLEDWISQRGYERTLADVNGDGLPDVVGFFPSGVYVALNEGDGVFSAPTLAINDPAAYWSSQLDNPGILLTDVNQDGRADIVGFGAQGVYVALGQADGSFGPYRLELNNFGWSEGWDDAETEPRIYLATNGKPTILGFGGAGVYTANLT